MSKLITLIFLIILNQNHMAQKTFKYLALGDSYTIGESVEESRRFPVQLVKRLDIAEYKVDEPVIIAKTGWTTGELLNAVKERELCEKFDLVSLLIGVNNQYRGEDTAQYRQEFRELLKIAINYAQDPENVIVVSIPDWGVTPFAGEKGADAEKVSREIDDFNRINENETNKAGAHYVNITDISRRADPLRGMLAEDGLHPSKKMYSLWVDRIYRKAKLILDND